VVPLVFLNTNQKGAIMSRKSNSSSSKSSRIRKHRDDTFKIKVVLESLKETMTMAELASKYEVHPNQIRIWKKQFLERAGNVFESNNSSEKQELEALRKENERLVHQIGEQAVDIAFLKKNLKKLNLL